MPSTSKKRWPWVLLIIAAALLLPAVLLQQLAVDVSLSQWHSNATGYQAALAEQANTGKPLAVFFHTDWCSSCKQLRKDVLVSEPFNQFLPNVIPVKINPETGPVERTIADHFGVMGYPTFLLVSSNPERVIPVRGTSNVKPEEFVQACRQALHRVSAGANISG